MNVRSSLGGMAQRRPNVVILAGRAVYQVGAFAAIVFPAVALSDAEAQRVVVPLTVSTLVVASVLVALQIGIVRFGSDDPRYRRSYQINAVIGLILVLVSTAISWLLGDRDGSSLLVGALYALGTLGLSSSMLSATRLSVAGRKLASAVTEIICGGVLLIGSTLLVVAHETSVTVWAVSFAAMGLLCAMVGIVVQPQDSSVDLGLIWHESLSALTASRSLVIGGAIMAAFNRADYLLMEQLAVPSQSNRYVIATRLSAPIMVALSALNNSLFVDQTAVKDDPRAVEAVTTRFTSKMMKLAGVVTLGTIIAVVLLDRVVPAIGARHIVAPAAILAVASLVFASAVPWGFAFTSIGREQLWNRVLIGALCLDLVGVAVFGRLGAVPVAICWLVTQVVVVGLVRRARRAAGL